MITIIAAAVLSCSEAKSLVNRIDSTNFSRREYAELVNTVAASAPRNCRITARPGLYRGQVRRARNRRRHSRPVIITRPVVTFRF